jgi:hypothetical protein
MKWGGSVKEQDQHNLNSCSCFARLAHTLGCRGRKKHPHQTSLPGVGGKRERCENVFRDKENRTTKVPKDASA